MIRRSGIPGVDASGIRPIVSDVSGLVVVVEHFVFLCLYRPDFVADGIV